MLLAIYSPTKSERTKLTSFISQYGEIQHLNIEVNHYCTMSSLLNSRKAYDMLFVDISIDTENTIMLIKEYLIHKETLITFIDNNDRDALTAYNLGIIHYFLFPITMDHVSKSLTRCRKLHNCFNDSTLNLLVKTKDETHIVPIHSIQYIEANDKLCIIYTNDTCFHSTISLNQMLLRNNLSDFLRIHRSFAINLNHVLEFKNYKVILKKGISLPVSRKNYMELKSKYQDYIQLLAPEQNL